MLPVVYKTYLEEVSVLWYRVGVVGTYDRSDKWPCCGTVTVSTCGCGGRGFVVCFCFVIRLNLPLPGSLFLSSSSLFGLGFGGQLCIPSALAACLFVSLSGHISGLAEQTDALLIVCGQYAAFR